MKVRRGNVYKISLTINTNDCDWSILSSAEKSNTYQMAKDRFRSGQENK